MRSDAVSGAGQALTDATEKLPEMPSLQGSSKGRSCMEEVCATRAARVAGEWEGGREKGGRKVARKESGEGKDSCIKVCVCKNAES